MEREIKFRGRRLYGINEGEWAYGYFFKNNEQAFIMPIFEEPYQHDQESYEVDPETVGQYTGLKDKSGKGIYQGDVIRVQNKLNTDFHGEYSLHEVVIIHGQAVRSYLSSSSGKNLPRGYLRGFLLDEYEYDMKLFIWADESDYTPSTDIEVVGSIYENPELLTQK